MYKTYKKVRGKKVGPYYYKTIRTGDGKIKAIYLGRTEEEALKREKKLNELKQKSQGLPVERPTLLLKAIGIAFIILVFFLASSMIFWEQAEIEEMEISYTRLFFDPHIRTEIISSKLVGEDLVVRFFHNSPNPEPVTVVTDRKYMLSTKKPEPGKTATLRVYSWNETDYLELKIGSTSDIFAFGKIPEKTFEVVSKRSANSRTFRNPDKTYTTKISLTKNNVLENGIWKPVEKAESLKTAWSLSYLEIDPDFDILLNDVNYTYVNFTLRISPELVGQGIPFRYCLIGGACTKTTIEFNSTELVHSLYITNPSLYNFTLGFASTTVSLTSGNVTVDGYVTETYNSSDSCNSAVYTKNTDHYKAFSGTLVQTCIPDTQDSTRYRMFFEFNTSSIPNGSSIENVNLSYYGIWLDSGSNVSAMQIDYSITGLSDSNASNYNIWTDIENGTLYAHDMNTSEGWHNYSLGSAAALDLQSRLDETGRGWFAVGISSIGCTSGCNLDQIYTVESAYDPELIVVYTPDTKPPNVTWSSPSANNSLIPANQSFIFWNFSSDDNLSSCKFEINGTNYTGIVSADSLFCYYNQTGLTANYTYCAYGHAQDLGGNWNTTDYRCATLNGSDTVPPYLSFASPTLPNQTTTGNNWIYINVTSNETLNACLLDWYNGSWNNLSMTVSGTYCYKNITSIADYNYYFRVYGNDSAGNMNVTEDRQITLDTTPPPLNFTAPTLANESKTNKTWIYINVTSNETLTSCTLEIWKSYTMKFTEGNITDDGYVSYSDCCGESYIRDNSSSIASAYYSSYNCSCGDSWTLCVEEGKIFLEFNTSAIPNGSEIVSINFTYYGDGQGQDSNAVYSIDNSTSNYPNNDTGNEDLFNDIGSGTQYTSGINTSLGWHSYSLSSSAASDLQSQLDETGSGWFGIGITATCSTYDDEIDTICPDSDAIYTVESAYDPILAVTYLYPTNYTMNLSSANNNKSAWANMTGLNDGKHYFRVRCNDATGNSNITEDRQTTVDTTDPHIDFVSPTLSNESITNKNWIYINISGIENLSSCTLNWYNGSWSNLSMTVSGTYCYMNMTSLSDRVYYFRAYANDTADNWDVTEDRQTEVDTTPTPLSFVYPTPSNESITNKNWIYINISGTENLSSCVLELWDSDGSVQRNITLTGGNITSDGSVIETYVWDGYEYGCDEEAIYSRDTTDTIAYSGHIQTCHSGMDDITYSMFFEFDTTDVPNTINFDDVRFYYLGNNQDTNSYPEVHPMQYSISDYPDTQTGNEWLQLDIINGTSYAIINTTSYSWHDQSLGSSAVSDLQNQLSAGWFGIGIYSSGCDPEVQGCSGDQIYTSESDFDPQLILIYYEYTGNWTNYTMSLGTGNRSAWINMTGLNEASYYFRVYCNETVGNWNVTEDRQTGIDLSAPFYTLDQDNASATAFDGDTVTASVYWNDSMTNVTYVVLRTNKTGSWANESSTYINQSSGYANISIDTAGHTGETICWVQWAGDSLNHWNASMSQAAHCFNVNSMPAVSKPRAYLQDDETSNFRRGQDVTIKVDVTDADGAADIVSVLLMLLNPDSAKVLNNVSMQNISAITNGYTYRYNYTLPSNAKLGTWTIQIYANDSAGNLGYNTSTFIVTIGNTVQIKLTLNNTNNRVYIPGTGEIASASITNTTYTNPEHKYLASYFNNTLRGLVFSQQNFAELSVNRSGTTHMLVISQYMENSQTFLPFTRGSWEEIDSKINMIENLEFLANIVPSFSYGLGTKYVIRMLLQYSNINLQGNITLRRGTHKLVMESTGTIGGKQTINITTA